MDITSIKLTKSEKIKIANTDDLHAILIDILKRESKIDQEKEHFWFIGLNASDYILCIDTVSLGSIEAVEVSPMNVFRNGVWKGAKYAILAHNHPSGVLKPSRHDIDLTDRLYQCGRILNIPITDHVIVSMKTYYSFETTGLMKKIDKSIKYVPPYELKERWAKEAEAIRMKAVEEGRKLGMKEGELIGEMKGIQKGEIIGVKKGEIIGIEKGKLIVAKKLKGEGMSVKDIMGVTGLKKKDIEGL